MGSGDDLESFGQSHGRNSFRFGCNLTFSFALNVFVRD